MPPAPRGRLSVAAVDRTFPPRLLATAALGAALVLAAGLAGAVPPLTAVALAGAGASVVSAAALLSRGLAIHVAAGAGRNTPYACACAGMFGLGVLAGGVTAVALPLAPSGHRPVVATAGLAATSMLLMVGMLYIPGLASGLVARLRHGLDGLLLAITLALIGWLIVPRAGTHPSGFIATVIAVTCALLIAIMLRRSTRQRPAVTRCGTGAMVIIAGLALLAILVGRDAPGWSVLGAATLAVAGPPLAWAGVRRVDLTLPADGRPAAEESVGRSPALAVPIAAAVLAVAYHLIVVGLPDRTAVVLSLGVGAMLTARDVFFAADLRRYARHLTDQQAHLRALVSGASDVAMVLSEDLVVRWQSPAAAHQFGLTDQEVVGRPLTDRIHPDDLASFSDQLRLVTAADGRQPPASGPVFAEARMLDGAGQWRETESTISDLRGSPEIGALVVQVRDVGQRRHLERTLHRLTSTDQRTGLLNRRELTRAITTRQHAGQQSGVLVVIDLHGVAAVNDLRGRQAGDAVLAEAARRIRAQVGTEGVASRIGESQFAVVTAAGPIEAYALGVRLLEHLTGQYQLGDRPVQLQASAGLAELSSGTDADEVIRHSSMALRQANQLGRNQIEWYDQSLEQRLVRRLDLERHLPGAAGRGELDLVYQPVVEMDDGRPVGVEALLRWRHPALGTVLPGELLPVAERLQLSVEIGEWVLHAACRQVAAWRRDGHDLWLAVNVSASQLAGADFVPEVAAALSVHQTPPERLIVEITDAEIGGRRREPCARRRPDPDRPEGDGRPQPGTGRPAGAAGPAADTAADRDADDLPVVAAQLSKLRALGVQTALSGFGVGHTNLARLRRLPLDAVKLVTPSSSDPARDLARAVVDLTRRLGLTVIAEGLETQVQWRLAREAGCRYGQGRVVAPPAPPERVEAYLETQRTPSR